MSRAESIIIGLAVGVACPFSLVVFCWWIAAGLSHYHIVPIAETGIATAAVTGLGIGIILDAFFLKKWRASFYSADVKLMVLLYLFWSVIAVAFLMGMPFGNLVLGTITGFYVGRKRYHAGTDHDTFVKATRTASIFTALVTSAEALPIGILALDESMVVETIQAVTGLEHLVIHGPIGIGLVTLACVVLFVIQFWSTRTAAAFAFRFNRVAVKRQTTNS